MTSNLLIPATGTAPRGARPKPPAPSQYVPTSTAARYLGVTPETLRSWRRRGIGPAFTRLPGGHLRDGEHYWHEKQNGTIVYSWESLQSFAQRLAVQHARMPRPFPGRLPGRRSAPK